MKRDLKKEALGLTDIPSANTPYANHMGYEEDLPSASRFFGGNEELVDLPPVNRKYQEDEAEEGEEEFIIEQAVDVASGMHMPNPDAQGTPQFDSGEMNFRHTEDKLSQLSIELKRRGFHIEKVEIIKLSQSWFADEEDDPNLSGQADKIDRLQQYISGNVTSTNPIDAYILKALRTAYSIVTSYKGGSEISRSEIESLVKWAIDKIASNEEFESFLNGKVQDLNDVFQLSSIGTRMSSPGNIEEMTNEFWAFKEIVMTPVDLYNDMVKYNEMGRYDDFPSYEDTMQEEEPQIE